MGILEDTLIALGLKQVKVGDAAQAALKGNIDTPPILEPNPLPYIEETASYKAISQLLDNGAPMIFVYGRAGAGKSTLIQYLSRSRGDRNIAIVAPTGIAAINAGGVTVHSFFGFPHSIIEQEDIKRNRKKQQMFEKLDLLIVDEVSMIRADVMEAISESLKINRNEPSLHFGGCQILLIGDLWQLPPIVDRQLQSVYNQKYSSKWFFSAPTLEKHSSMIPIELTETFRQKDQEWLEVLDNMRSGRNIPDLVTKVNQLCKVTTRDPNSVALTCTNTSAGTINQEELDKLTGELHTYWGKIEDNFGSKSDSNLPAPYQLELKQESRVMFRKNDSAKRWVNGTLGTVCKLHKDTIAVKIDDGSIVNVEPETWEKFSYDWEPMEEKIIKVKTGTYTQFPLQLAWAFTIHKAQGLTLSSTHIDLGRGTFENGQAYVAFSRCRNASDITMERALRPNDIKADRDVLRFYEKLK